MSNLTEHLRAFSLRDGGLPESHAQFLHTLKNKFDFEPKVIYDIGCCVLHWTRRAEEVWPDAEYVLFDAFCPAAFLYSEYKHFVGLLSDSDNRIVPFYQNDYMPTGNSYYREIGCEGGKYFPRDKYIMKTCHKLDTVVKEHNLPPPDLVKIDVQGSEIDVIKGAHETLKHARVLIVELQHTQYNEGAMLSHESKSFIESQGWMCIAERFSDNGPDADYCFVNTSLSQLPCTTLGA